MESMAEIIKRLSGAKPDASIQYDLPHSEEERQIKWNEVMVKLSNLPLNTYAEYRFDNYILRNKDCALALEAVKRFVTADREHHFLTLASKIKGVGKTHLAIALGWEWLEQNRTPILYFQTGELLDDLRQGFHIDNPYQQQDFDTRMRRMKTVPALILDDLGVEQSTAWARERLDIIIDHRYLNRIPTVVTTNLLPEQLEGRISSRLQEGVVVHIMASDFRLEKARMRARNGV